MTDKAFEDWWKLLKPAECDEVEEHFRECWQAATLAERERCAKVCDDLQTNVSQLEVDDSERGYNAALCRASKCIRALPEDRK